VLVLGVDPGLTRCGLAVVDGVAGRQVTAREVGVVGTGPEVAVEARLGRIADELERWIARHRPDAVAVERVFAQHNVRTVMATAQASAVAMLVAGRAGIAVATYTPSEVKASVTGNGRADKAQVTAMVTRLLRLDAPPRPADAADALALGICHLWRGVSTAKVVAAADANPSRRPTAGEQLAAVAASRDRSAVRTAP
jgi:crossover junction endodeoxyribonuclease RuvC